MAEMKRYVGWYVRHPWFLREKPEKLTDLIIEIHGIEANFEPPNFYTTKEEAVQQVKGYLMEQRDQALRNLDFLSKPYTSPNGITHICPEHLMERWLAECRSSLVIAERGLELCEPAHRGNLS